MRLPAQPGRVDVDPEVDVFRCLHREEISGIDAALWSRQSFSRAAGCRYRRDQAGLSSACSDLAPDLIPGSGDTLGPGDRHPPTDRAVWLFGWENRFLPEVTTALTSYGVGLAREGRGLPGNSPDT